MQVSTNDVLRVRRSAHRLRTWAPCISCKAHGKKCSQHRPCSSCLKSGMPCFKLEQAEKRDLNFIHTAVIPAQRPLNFQLRFAIGNESTPVIALAQGMLWANIELMKHQAFGHQMDSLGRFFASLTVHDSSALSMAIHLATTVGRSTVHAAPKTLDAPDDRDASEGEHSKFWDVETGTSSFRTTFDPMSSRRRDIIANACHASMYGVHPEEFQARCASRELPFPFAEEDAVALIIYRTVGQQFRSEASPERFLRIYVGKGCGTAKLFSVRTSIATDAFGRISAVRPFLQSAQ
jgi:hypothetical protein